MNNVLEDSLFVSQNRKFDEIQSIVRQFSAEYVGNSVIKDNIFAVIQNYARKKEIALELLRYPIHDDECSVCQFGIAILPFERRIKLDDCRCRAVH